MSLQIVTPFEQFFDAAGTPLDNGSVYIGTPNLNPETNPIQVYWDDARTTPAAQPIKTSGGYMVRNGTPARVYTSADNYSMTVKDKKGRIVWTVAEATSVPTISGSGGAALVGADDGAGGTLFTTVAGFIAWIFGGGLSSSLIKFIQSGTGAVARTVQDKMLEVEVSITDFGAVLDGSDISDALQKALTRLSTSGGKLKIPASASVLSLNAAVSVTMSANTKLTIECHSKIACNSVGSIAITGDVANPESNSGLWVGTTELKILGLDLSASATSLGTVTGLYVTGMKKVMLFGIRCNGFSHDGFYVLQSKDVSVLNCSAEGNMYAGFQYGTIDGIVIQGGSYSNNGDPTAIPTSTYGYGVACSAGSSYIYPSKNILVSGITANGNLRKGIDFHNGTNVLVIGNTVIGYGSAGIYAVGENTGKIVSNVTIMGNYIDGTGNTILQTAGVEIGTYGTSVSASGDFKVIGNTLVATGVASGRAIICTNAASGVQIESLNISGNTIRNGASSTTEVIKVYTTAGLRIKRAMVAGNTIHSSSATYPIFIDGVIDSVTVDNNQITVDSGTVTMGIYVFEAGSIACQISNNTMTGGATYTKPIIEDPSIGSYTTRNNNVKGVAVRDVYASGRSIEYGSGIPTSTTGYYRQGSIVWAMNAGAGSAPGWVCVASGSPGVWKSMAALAP
jgi:hypothetical protein